MKKSQIFSILLFTIIYPSIGLACKCGSLNFVNNLSNSPDSAKLAIVGKFVQIGSKAFIKPIRGWTENCGDIDVSMGTYCIHGGLITNTNFLVLSQNTTRANRCNSLILSLNDASKYIEKLAKMENFVGELNPSWQFCESDSECLQSRDECGNPIGVNKKYENDYLSFLKSKKAKLDCSKLEKPKTSVSKCVENFCS